MGRQAEAMCMAGEAAEAIEASVAWWAEAKLIRNVFTNVSIAV